MTDMDELQLLDTATAAARAGGAELRRLFGVPSLDVRSKGRNDFVTEADHLSENAVVAEIQRSFPHHAILAEESGALGGSSKHEWVIDPLDGTTNFLQGLPVFCVSVACQRQGELLAGAVYEPLSDRMFAAARGCGATLDGAPIRVSERCGLDGAFLATGFPFRAHGALDRYLGAFREIFLQARAIRRCGAAALDLAHTAAGIYDGFFELRLSPWDLAAGVLLVREAGGAVTDLDGGQDFLASGNVVAGAPGVQPALRAAVARHADEAALAHLRPEIEEPVGAG
ncbi:MAG TPA: inositol monophosphatase family protein [Thermoanaerobaculia bacterium]|nr:inositol monophosphatase family protein [Thermoanaerobaculia bacterium]